MYEFEKVLEITFRSPDAANIFLFGGMCFLAFFFVSQLFGVLIDLISKMIAKIISKSRLVRDK